jgi:hypothetical protein
MADTESSEVKPHAAQKRLIERRFLYFIHAE